MGGKKKRGGNDAFARAMNLERGRAAAAVARARKEQQAASAAETRERTKAAIAAKIQRRALRETERAAQARTVRRRHIITKADTSTNAFINAAERIMALAGGDIPQAWANITTRRGEFAVLQCRLCKSSELVWRVDNDDIAAGFLPAATAANWQFIINRKGGIAVCEKHADTTFFGFKEIAQNNGAKARAIISKLIKASKAKEGRRGSNKRPPNTAGRRTAMRLTAAANPNAVDNDSNTALDTAKKQGHSEIVRLLKEAETK